MYRCSRRIKSLPSCSKYQSPLDELVRVPFSGVIQIIELRNVCMCIRGKKNTSFRLCIPIAVDYLVAHRSFCARSRRAISFELCDEIPVEIPMSERFELVAQKRRFVFRDTFVTAVFLALSMLLFYALIFF